MKKIFGFLLALCLAVPAFAGNVTGVIQYSNGVTIKNGTVTFAPSQLGYKAGSFVQVANSVSCYTDLFGSVVGVPNTLALPLLAGGAGGSLSGTVYVKITYWNATGEGAASPELAFVMGANTRLTVTAPVLQPASATGYKVYVGSSTGAEQLQLTITGWGNATVNSISAGAAAPSANTSICQLTFNDSIIPSYTTYFTTVKDSNGNTLAGYPQNYYFTGSTVDLTNMTPAGNLAVKFPSAMLLNPPGNASQTVNGAISSTGDTSGNTLSANVADGVTSPININSNQQNVVVPNLMVGRLSTTIQVNGVPSTYAIPNLAGSGWGFIIGTAGNNLDCTQANLICTLTTKSYFEAAGCNNVTPAFGWDTLPTNAPTVACLTGTNTQKGVLDFKAAVNLEQSKANNLNPASATTITLTPLTTTANDLLIAVVSVLGSQTITGCNDGSAYTLAKRQQNGVTLGVEIWYRQNASALSGATLTCTAGGSSVMALQFYEYSGAAAVALDVVQGGTGTGTSLASTATASSAQASNLIFAGAAVAGTGLTQTAGAGFNAHTISANTQSTGITAISEGSIANAIATFTGPQTINSSAVWAEAIAVFKASSSTAATVTAQRGYLLPADFVAPLNANVVWFNRDTPNTGAIGLGVATICSATGATDDSAFNTAGTATLAVPAVANTQTTSSVLAIPVTGCNAGNLMHLQIQRVAGSANDNYEGPLRFYGLEITTSRAQ